MICPSVEQGLRHGSVSLPTSRRGSCCGRQSQARPKHHAKLLLVLRDYVDGSEAEVNKTQRRAPNGTDGSYNRTARKSKGFAAD